jgi:general secretion pathway protein H
MRDAQRRNRQAGVTLIEVMIVLVVIGIATGATTLGLGALARDDRVEQEARRLAGAISAGVDEALIASKAQLIRWDREGYQIGDTLRRVLDPSVQMARADRAADAAVISAHMAEPAVVFELSGATGTWRVTLDGLTVITEPDAAR